jgi:hypothetical protein
MRKVTFTFTFLVVVLQAKLVSSNLSIREAALSWKSNFVRKILIFQEHEKNVKILKKCNINVETEQERNVK